MLTPRDYASVGESDTPASTPSSRGRRRGDAVLLAWKFARERGDMDVADQLMLEYESIRDLAPPRLTTDRRKNTGTMHGALRGLWAWFTRR
jgi:hypothetical protein